MIGTNGIVVKIGIDEVKGVLFSSFLGKFSMERMVSVPIEDGKTQVAVEKLLSGFPSDAGVTLCLPGNLFMIRKVLLPFTDRKKIRKTLPYEMDGLLPFPIDEMLIDSVLSSPSEKGSGVIATAIPKKLLAHYLNLFPDNRKPAKVIPDFIALFSLSMSLKGEDGLYGVMEVEDGKASIVLLDNNRPVLARSIVQREAPTLMEEILTTIKPILNEGKKVGRLYVTGIKTMPSVDGIDQVMPLPHTVKNIPLGDHPSWTAVIGGALAEAEYPWFNILGLDAESERFEKILKSLSIGTAILLILGTADLYMRSRADFHKYEALKAETKKVFLSAMPEVRRVVKEDAQLKDALDREKGTLEALAGKPTPSYLVSLNSLGKIVAEHPEIRVREAFFEVNGLTVSGDVSGVEADKIKTIFTGIEKARGVQVEEMVKGVDPNSYRFRVKVELMP